jgi:DNA invertase Pin-like site-specific DNA recombinase
VFAELETSLRKERQLEGMASAKARGVDKGRIASNAARDRHYVTHPEDRGANIVIFEFYDDEELGDGGAV